MEGGAMTEPIHRVSASALNALDQCSYAFYQSRYMKLPERVWERTSVGSVAHSILECLRRDRHRAAHDAIKAAGTIHAAPSVTRLLRALQVKWAVSDTLIAEIDAMILLVLARTNYLDEGATKTFDPEHGFTLMLPSGAVVRGFIDRLAVYGDRAVVTDYKSQGRRFEASDLVNNFQALTYQLYCHKVLGLPAQVDFIMLRHPPTKRTPEKHIQSVKPASAAQLEGFEYYLDHIYRVMQGFGLQDAYESFCEDVGFCRNVCSFYSPAEYWSVTSRATGELIANYPLDKAPQVGDNQMVTKKTYKGCPARWNA